MTKPNNYNETGDIRDIGVDDHSSGVHYRFWTNGTAVGYEVQFDDGRPIQFFYLNPSDDTDDGIPNVFLYQGRDADPGSDAPLCFYVMGDADKSMDGGETATCKHCGRSITRESGAWVDINAAGDDVMWRETCDSHDTSTAEHEPAGTDDLLGNDDDMPNLYDADTNEWIGYATPEQVAASAAAANKDGGAGIIRIDRKSDAITENGRRVYTDGWEN